MVRIVGILQTVLFSYRFDDLSLMTRFHKLVTRCYCPSDEVAKRAVKAGLKPSQIKVYGLPVRPSFVKPVRPKVGRFSWEIGIDFFNFFELLQLISF